MDKGTNDEEIQTRALAAKIALFAFGLTVIAALWGLVEAVFGDWNSAGWLVFSGVMTLLSGMGFVTRSRGH